MRSRFTDLHLRHTDAKQWTVVDDFRFFSKDQVYVVPGGFKTDLDSVPRVPLVYALFKGRATKSAVIHDYLYVKRKGKLLADAVFLEAMKAEGLPLRHRWPIYIAVALFGWGAYSRKST